MCNAGHERKRCQTRRAGNYYRAVGRKTKSCWQPAGRPSGMFRQEAGGEDRHLSLSQRATWHFLSSTTYTWQRQDALNLFSLRVSLSVKSPKHVMFHKRMLPWFYRLSNASQKIRKKTLKSDFCYQQVFLAKFSPELNWVNKSLLW